MARAARLRIEGDGDVEVEVLASFLSDLENAYSSILVFERTLDRFARGYFPDFWSVPYPSQRRLVRRGPRFPVQEDSRLFVPARDRLRLSSVELASPGFWEFIGSLNPLEVMRKYLEDRHRRRQDKEYRESAEKRRLELENLELENTVLRERIQIARDMGFSDSDLAPFLRELIERPLRQLGTYQDRGVISTATLKNDLPD